MADPAYAFSIIFPIISTCSTHLAANILMVSVIAEWSNAILKWILREDRPYWWVRETDLYINYPHIKQTELTCETGPGNPSGHVMGAAALLFVLIKAFITKYSQRYRNTDRKNIISIVFWFIYVLLILLVSISRMYLGTHFFHQCIFGAVLGFMIGYYFGNQGQFLTEYWQYSNKLKMLCWVIVLLIITVSLYWLQKYFGIDPQWSVKMAFKWCERPENVHVNTTPLFTLVRDFGLAFGIISISPLMGRLSNVLGQSPMVKAACTLVYCTTFYMAQASVPVHDAKIFYLCHAILYSTKPFILIGFIPKFASVKRKTN